MRKNKLFTQLAESVQRNFIKNSDGILVASKNVIWPQCAVCRKDVDSAAIEDRGPDPENPCWFEVRVKCHGKESFGKVESDVPVPKKFWGKLVATGVFFREELEHQDGFRSRVQ